jgi:hypothetical protein
LAENDVGLITTGATSITESEGYFYIFDDKYINS